MRWGGGVREDDDVRCCEDSDFCIQFLLLLFFSQSNGLFFNECHSLHGFLMFFPQVSCTF